MDYSLKNLRQTQAHEYKQEPTGDYTINRKGRRVPVTRGTEYVHTKAGTMPLAEWVRRMERAVEKEGQTDLLNRIIDYCRKLAWLKKEQDIRDYALECLSGGAYKHWDDFQEGRES